MKAAYRGMTIKEDAEGIVVEGLAEMSSDFAIRLRRTFLFLSRDEGEKRRAKELHRCLHLGHEVPLIGGLSF